MTTQELKQQIDKVLGNSIRCLLPSYWWKRAFGAVIDNTISKDEVKTINGVSLLGGGNLQLGDGQTIVYDDSAVYERIAEVEELAAQAKVSSELAIEELNIHLEEVNEGLFEQVSQLMKDLDDLAERVAELERIIQQQ